MILKIADGKLHTLGEGTLTEFHISKGYKEVPTENIFTKEDGSYYEYYNDDLTPDLVRIQAEDMVKLVAHGEELVKKLVQTEIDKYNNANGVRFESITNCVLYKDDVSHPHQQFCVDIVAYNSLVWKEARELQPTVMAMNPLPTDDEFIAMFTKFGV